MNTFARINRFSFPAVVAMTVLFAAFVAPRALATDASEGPDFSNSAPGTSYTLTLGANTFSGTVTTTADGRDHFRVVVLAGLRITQVSKTVTGGGFSGFVSFNNETISGTGTANFTGQFATPYPLPPGTYDAYVNADFSTGSSWSVTVTVGAEPNYSVTSAGGQITITDNSNNSDTLSITNPVAGFIRFDAAGRTFGVNGGALLNNSSGNISLAGINFISVYPGNGTNVENISAFSGNNFPSLDIFSGTNSDTVNFNGDITFASGDGLYVDLQNGSPKPNSVTIAPNANIIATGTGPISVYASRSVDMGAGSSFEVLDGYLTMEANKQTTPTAGDFIGINLNGATIKSTGTGYVTVNGTGGDGAGSVNGYQFGVQVVNGAKVIGGDPGAVILTGNGGASSNIVNRGVSVEGAGSSISSSGGQVSVSGTGGPVGTGFGIGVSVLNGGEIRAGGSGNLTVTGTGTGSGGGENRGLELGGGGARISSGGGNIGITGTGGPGGSFGLIFADDGIISTPASGGNIVFHSDLVSVAANASIFTTNPASLVQFAPITFDTTIALGNADIPGGPAIMGLTDAELDRVQSANLVIGGGGSGGINLNAPISHPTATNLTLLPGSGGIFPGLVSTNIALNGTVAIPFGALNYFVLGTNTTDYSRFKVAGGVSLTGATTGFLPFYAGQVGDSFTIVDNDGADPIIGNFTGLPEGAYLAWPGSPLLNGRISYVGGDGNDVVLTLVSALVVRNTSSSTNIGSLRSALAAAAASPGPDTITFDSSLNGQAILLTNQIEIADTNGVTIDGTAMTSGFAFSGLNVSRIFQNLTGSIATLKGFGFIGGNGTGTNGFNNGGGAIVNNGTMILSRCTFYNNNVSLTGGAIYNDSVLSLTNCTFYGNTASALGGAIANDGTLALTHCTVSGNYGGSAGGGIYNGGVATVANSIVSGNTSPTGADIRNFTIMNYIGTNLVAVLTGNVPGGPAANTSAALLAILGAYGGNTTTMALLPGSPARNAAVGSSATSDQRGFPIVGIPDIGAYEAGTYKTYNIWAVETISTNFPPGSNAHGADPDGDGRINAIEYATLTSGSDPDPGTALIFTLKPDGTSSTNTFNYQANATDLFYQLDRSTNLPAAWTTLFDFRPSTAVTNVFVPGVIATTNGSVATIIDTNITGWPRAFYRLRVTISP
ncbi:MAG: hypothetical protein IT579_19450 [Verrucomicrobia subdivision 3 bacterium]|nr:hypothetical protein [Limisphaerales bacterium]